MAELRGKVILVTGATDGLGRALAAELARAGATVLVHGRDPGRIADTIKEVTAAAAEADDPAAGDRVRGYQADLSSLAGVRDLADQVIAAEPRLDVLVNNAGTAMPKPFEEATQEEMDRVLDINVRGVFATTQAALKHMKDGGRIIMVGSAVGERAVAPGLVPYAATKGAVKMFTQALSREVGSRGITVNNVQPGPIDTDLNPATGDWAVPQKAATALDRYGHVDEIAAMVAFVAGSESSYITGANLTVDGGMNA